MRVHRKTLVRLMMIILLFTSNFFFQTEGLILREEFLYDAATLSGSKPTRKDSRPLELRQRFDELNLARLGLISIQERIPDDFNRWEIEFEIDGQPAKLACISHAEYGGVPHGLDNDVFSAIVDLFIEAGAPASGELVVTAHAILKRAGIDPNGRSYANLHQSLHRLRTAIYTAKEAWRDHDKRQWTSVTFAHLEQLGYSGEHENVGRGTVIRLELARQIVKSIRAKFLKPLDMGLLSRIERPLARALYRLLDARRYDPTQPDLPAVTLDVNLVDWARECKLNFTEAKRIRRALDPAHEELIANGYLVSAEYSGRGAAQMIGYVFGDGPSRGDALLGRVTKHGVGLPVARNLLRRLGVDVFEDRLAKAEHLLERGYKPNSKPGFLVDVLKDEGGKYPEPAEFSPPSVSKSRDEPERPLRSRDDRAEEEAERALREHERQLRESGTEAQVEYAMDRLTLMLGRHFDTRALAQVRHALEDGRVDPLVVAREAIKAVVENRAPHFVAELRRVIDAPPMLGAFAGKADDTPG